MSTQPSQLILALDVRSDVLCARTVQDACSGAFWSERFGERGRRHIEADSQHHIQHLKTALQFDDSDVLTQYAVWLQGVLTHRGMCSRHLVEHFNALARAIHAEMLPDASIAQSYLQQASFALSYASQPAGAVQAATEPISHLMLAMLHQSHLESDHRDRLARDIGYLLSYLTDAVALGASDVFTQYVAWIDEYFTRRHRTETYLAEILRSLEASLNGVGSDVRDLCVPLVAQAREPLPQFTR